MVGCPLCQHEVMLIGGVHKCPPKYEPSTPSQRVEELEKQIQHYRFELLQIERCARSSKMLLEALNSFSGGLPPKADDLVIQLKSTLSNFIDLARFGREEE